LLYAQFTGGLPTLAFAATILFVAAALGGVTLNLNYHWKHLALPKWLVVVHAVVAFTAFVLLLAAIWTQAASAR
jgi:hypothetical protein